MLNLGAVSVVPILADTLIRRVHVDQVSRRAFLKHFSVVVAHGLVRRQERRSPNDSLPHCVRVCPFSSVVRAVVKLTIPVVANGSLDTAGQQIKEVLRLVGLVELPAHTVVILAFPSKFTATVPVLLGQFLRAVDDRPPQVDNRAVRVVSAQKPSRHACRRLPAKLQQSRRMVRQAGPHVRGSTQRLAAQDPLTTLVRNRMWNAPSAVVLHRHIHARIIPVSANKSQRLSASRHLAVDVAVNGQENRGKRGGVATSRHIAVKFLLLRGLQDLPEATRRACL